MTGQSDPHAQLQAAATALQQRLEDTSQKLQLATERCVDLEAQLATAAPRPTVDCTVQAAVLTADYAAQAAPRKPHRGGAPMAALCVVALTAAAAGAWVGYAHGPRGATTTVEEQEKQQQQQRRRPSKPRVWTLRSVLALGRV